MSLWFCLSWEPHSVVSFVPCVCVISISVVEEFGIRFRKQPQCDVIGEATILFVLEVFMYGCQVVYFKKDCVLLVVPLSTFIAKVPTTQTNTSEFDVRLDVFREVSSDSTVEAQMQLFRFAGDDHPVWCQAQ